MTTRDKQQLQAGGTHSLGAELHPAGTIFLNQQTNKIRI